MLCSANEFQEKFYLSIYLIDSTNKMSKLFDERDLFLSYDEALQFGKKYVKERKNKSDLDFNYGFRVNKITVYVGEKNNG